MTAPALVIGELFAGIGGFGLAAEALGWRTAWVSEIDPFACAVLAKHFPHAPNLGDATAVDWSTVAPIDVLCGGFPCQPHSLAGKRKSSDDERDLWSECVRALGVLRPRYAVFENVSGLLTSESGRFFNRVISDLAALGYSVEWSTLSAAEVGAPHRRDRIWIVAYRVADADGGRCEQRDARERDAAITGAGYAPVGDTLDAGLQGLRGDGDQRREPGRIGARPHGSTAAPGVRLRNWSDAIPYRGADGTVRLVPSGALAGVAQGDTGRGRLDGIDGRRAGEVAADGHGELSGREAAGAGTQSEIRALADGLRDRLAGRGDGGEEAREVTVWPTPRSAMASIYPEYGEHWNDRRGGESPATSADTFAPIGGTDLWPVTLNEPGRVAKLKAIGNACVPLCIVLGPFARIQSFEYCRLSATGV